MNFWFSENHTPNVKISIRVDRQLYSGKSEFQRIDVFDSPEFGRFLTLDGYMMLTEKDEFIYHEMITHVPMAVHPLVKKVLVIGAGDGGVIRELTRYPEIEHIDMVEIDPLVVEVCRKYLPKTAIRPDDRILRCALPLQCSYGFHSQAFPILNDSLFVLSSFKHKNSYIFIILFSPAMHAEELLHRYIPDLRQPALRWRSW